MIKKSKPDYRQPYFKNFYNLLFAVTGGTIIASISYAKDLQQANNKSLFIIGFSLLVASSLSQLILALTNVINSGFDWDHQASGGKDKNSKYLGDFWGNVGKFSMFFAFLATFFGIVFLASFVVLNVE